jgi:hypothetical protein
MSSVFLLRISARVNVMPRLIHHGLDTGSTQRILANRRCAI